MHNHAMFQLCRVQLNIGDDDLYNRLGLMHL
jgi:hypothetical protein